MTRLGLSSVKYGSGTQEIIYDVTELLATGLFCGKDSHCLPVVNLPSSRDSLKLIVTQMAIVKLSGSQDKKDRN